MPPGAPRGGQSLGRGPMGKKSMLSPGTVCRFPSNFVGVIPRGLEPEVVHMGHVAPGGSQGEGPGAKFFPLGALLLEVFSLGPPGAT